MADKARTLVLLGGSAAQVVAIEAAKACGYRTVVCDYLPDNPGQFHADAYYCVSTTDREAVLEVARAEGAEGIVAFSSDPAAPTAAYVAEVLGLPTNPFDSVRTLCTKTLFREYLRKVGLPCPQSAAVPSAATVDEARELVRGLRLPIVVKPSDSSGSKGVTVLRDMGGLADALASARRFSRNGELIVEEYINNALPYIVGGDIFVVDGHIACWGLANCERNDMLPINPHLLSLPIKLSAEKLSQVKDLLQTLVTSLCLRFGEMNVEIIITDDGTPRVVELGARAGGVMFPVLLSDASGIDMVRACVMCAMGDDPGRLEWESDGGCYAVYIVHSLVAGEYLGLELSPEAEAACYRRVMYQEPGTYADAFDNCSGALGLLFFRFDSLEKMDKVLLNDYEHIRALVR